jgi:Helix-turn-helix domain
MTLDTLTEVPIYIGIPELARLLGKTRQDIHYRANRGMLPLPAYPLRQGRRIAYIFKETEVHAYLERRKVT